MNKFKNIGFLLFDLNNIEWRYRRKKLIEHHFVDFWNAIHPHLHFRKKKLLSNGV